MWDGRHAADPRGALAPANSPSVDKSSSSSGQWIPQPAPAVSQCARCSGVAAASRGYQANGTVIVRPSISATVNSSSLTATSRTRMSAPSACAEELMPCLQQYGLMLTDQSWNNTQITGRKANVAGQRDGLRPNLRRGPTLVQVYVRRLVRFAASEIHPKASDTEDGRHEWTSMVDPMGCDFFRRHRANRVSGHTRPDKRPTFV